MRNQPSLAAVVLVLGLALVGGAGAGLALARWAAPGVPLAAFVSFVLLPAALVVGFHTWLGAAILVLLSRLLRRGGERRARGAPGSLLVPPGAWTFVPVATLIGAAGGAVVGLAFAQVGFLRSLAAYTVAGAGYGTLLWRCALRGYLPFPESE